MENKEKINSLKHSNAEWFGEWFDSPYYHILYKHRDHEEAQEFLNNLNRYFDFEHGKKILDLACGKGRHSIYLNSKGMNVVGVDLSFQNIASAKKHENDRLHFYVHDMRETFRIDEFDYVLNLFTSFGYFDSEKENEKVVCTAAKALKHGGKFIIDFLNPYRVINNLVPCEEKIIEGVHFKISRHVKEGFIIKDIDFEDHGKDFHFHEKVKAITKPEFIRYFEKADLKLLKTYGNYQLDNYDQETSERMIFLLLKE